LRLLGPVPVNCVLKSPFGLKLKLLFTSTLSGVALAPMPPPPPVVENGVVPRVTLFAVISDVALCARIGPAFENTLTEELMFSKRSSA